MKQAILQIIFLLNFTILAAQTCLLGGITFTSQSQIDDFATNYPGCVEVLGNITISSGSNINSLSGLSQITSISGSLVITINDVLTSLTGLDNLTTIDGNLFILNNSALTSLSALSNLTSISEGLNIFGNEVLINLNGLNNLITIPGALGIAANDALTNFSGLDNLTSVGGPLNIQENNALLNFVGLDNLASIGLHLTIIDNDALSSLDGLGNLTSIGGNFEISHNGALSNISSLNNLTSINGLLAITINSTLTSLSGLDNINPFSISNLSLSNGAVLSTCEVQSICDYLDDPSNPATISNNSAGCNSRVEVEAECLILLPVELSDFWAKAHEGQVKLSWQTASENKNAGFEVQQSNDGRDWEILEFVEGKGTSDVLNDYQIVDYQPFGGINYYRLKQIDFDDAFTFSKVVSVNFSRPGDFQVFPNPTNGKINISGIETEKAKIFNGLGKLITEITFDQSEINISEYPQGVYFLQIVSNDQKIFTQKILKE